MIRKLLIGSLITIVLLIGTLLILPIFFKKQIGELVQKELNKQLNAKVAFDDYSFSLLRSFPKFSLSLDELSIVGEGDFEGDTLFYGEELSLKLNLMSVLRGDTYEVQKIHLEDPQISILVDQQGRANYNISRSGEKEAETETESNGGSGFKMLLDKVSISNGSFVYRDDKANQVYALTNFDLKAKGNFSSSRFDLETDLQSEDFLAKVGSVPYINHCALEMESLIEVDMENGKYAFKENETLINALPIALNGFVSQEQSAYVFDLDFKSPESNLKNLLSLIPQVYTSSFDDMEASGKANLYGHVQGDYGDGTYPSIKLVSDIREGQVKYDGLPSSINNLSLDLTVEKPQGSLDLMRVVIGKGHLEFNNDPLDFALNLSQLLSDPKVSGNVKTDLNLKNIAESFPIEGLKNFTGNCQADIAFDAQSSDLSAQRYSKVKAEGFFKMQDCKMEIEDLPPVDLQRLSMDLSPRYAQLNRFDAQLGKSKIKAKGRLENLINYYLGVQNLEGAIDLSGDLFDANEWMRYGSGSSGSEDVQEDQPETAEAYSIPQNLDLSMNLALDRLEYDDLVMKDVRGGVSVADGKLLFNKLEGKTLEGWMQVDGFYDSKNARNPGFNLDYTVKGADISKTFQAFNTVERIAPIAKYIEGKFSGKINAGGNMNPSMLPKMESLVGKGAALVLDGANIKNFPPLVELGRQLKFDKLSSFALKKTEAAFSFAENRVHLVNPIITWIDDMQITLGGSHGFDYSLDYRMIIELPKNKLSQLKGVESQVNAEISKLGLSPKQSDKLRLDVLFKGTMEKPKVEIDWKSALQALSGGIVDQGKEMIQNQIDKSKKEVEEKVNQELDAAKKKAQEEIDAAKAKAEAELQKKQAELEKKRQEAEEKLKEEAAKKKKELEEQVKDKIKLPKFP